MNKKLKLVWLISAMLTASLLIGACGAGGEEQTPTPNPDQIQTQAVATFAGFLTATAQAMPTETPTATESPSPTITATIAPSNTPAPTAAQSGADACYGLRYVSDETIPDNTEMAPGEEFTKTWRVRNNGTCPWLSGFELRFIGGEAMDGEAVELNQAVQAGAETELSVDLTAPDEAGTYRGNWRLATAGGEIFGDEIFVQIVVEGEAATATVEATATKSASATLTEVPTSTTAPTEEPTETSEP